MADAFFSIRRSGSEQLHAEHARAPADREGETCAVVFSNQLTGSRDTGAGAALTSSAVVSSVYTSVSVAGCCCMRSAETRAARGVSLASVSLAVASVRRPRGIDEGENANALPAHRARKSALRSIATREALVGMDSLCNELQNRSQLEKSTRFYESKGGNQ